jgi:hypothetical protein
MDVMRVMLLGLLVVFQHVQVAAEESPILALDVPKTAEVVSQLRASPLGPMLSDAQLVAALPWMREAEKAAEFAQSWSRFKIRIFPSSDPQWPFAGDAEIACPTADSPVGPWLREALGLQSVAASKPAVQRWESAAGRGPKAVLEDSGAGFTLGLNREPGPSGTSSTDGQGVTISGDLGRWYNLVGESLPFSYRLTAEPSALIEEISVGQEVGGRAIEREVWSVLPAAPWFVLAVGFDPQNQSVGAMALVAKVLGQVLSMTGGGEAPPDIEKEFSHWLATHEVAPDVQTWLADAGGTWLVSGSPCDHGFGLSIVAPDTPGVRRLLSAIGDGQVRDGAMSALSSRASAAGWWVRAQLGRVLISNDRSLVEQWGTKHPTAEWIKESSRIPADATVAIISKTSLWAAEAASWLELLPGWKDLSQDPVLTHAPTILRAISRHAPTGYIWARPGSSSTQWSSRGILPIPGWMALIGGVTTILREELPRRQREAQAVDLLRRIHQAQIMVQAGLLSDRDKDNLGEFVTLRQLAGITDGISTVGQEIPLPAGAGPQPLVPDEVAMGRPKFGYRLMVSLPTRSDAPNQFDVDLCETRFAAYAVPESFLPGRPNRMFAVQADGVIRVFQGPLPERFPDRLGNEWAPLRR